MLLDVRKAVVSHFVGITNGLAGCISLTLPWCPSVNHTWRLACRRAILDPKVETFRRKVIGKVNFLRAKRCIPSKPLDCDCMVLLEYLPPDRRRRDIDNGCKAVFDSLTHAGVWRDDSQVKLMLSYFGERVKGGAVNVLIQPLEV